MSDIRLLLLAECLAFLASGSDPTIYSARQSVFHLRRCFLFILCAHNISTDLLIVSMHEKPNGIYSKK